LAVRFVRPAGSSAPVTPLAALDSRKAIASATSDGLTQCDMSASGIAARFFGVSIVVGKTALTRMRSLRTSSARLSVSRSTALLVAL
jgi:hypothetical protein